MYIFREVITDIFVMFHLLKCPNYYHCPVTKYQYEQVRAFSFSAIVIFVLIEK